MTTQNPPTTVYILLYSHQSQTKPVWVGFDLHEAYKKYYEFHDEALSVRNEYEHYKPDFHEIMKKKYKDTNTPWWEYASGVLFTLYQWTEHQITGITTDALKSRLK